MVFSIQIGPETEEVVERLAVHSGRSKDETLRALFEKALEDAEDLHDAEQATLARQEGRETTITQEEMEKLLGLGDYLPNIGAEDPIEAGQADGPTHREIHGGTHRAA